MGGLGTRKPSLSTFFPAPFGLLAPADAAKKTLRSGPPLTLRPRFPLRSRRGSGVPAQPMHGPPSQGDRPPANNLEDSIMASIGVVTRLPDGSYKGQLKTLTIRADIEIVANQSKAA